jgi:hypothetical protein
MLQSRHRDRDDGPRGGGFRDREGGGRFGDRGGFRDRDRDRDDRPRRDRDAPAPEASAETPREGDQR